MWRASRAAALVTGPARSTRSEASLTAQRTTAPWHQDLADIDLVRQGDEAAFERLYRRHVGHIYGLACRLAGAQAADDLTQDVFVRAWEKVHTFRAESQFGTWLYRLAVNVIIEERRGVTRRRAVEDDDDDVASHASVGPNDPTFSIDFEAAVDRLPAAARRVFVLHDVEGYMHREVASLVGITSGTSKGQLHRARMILRKHLGAGRRRPSERVQP